MCVKDINICAASKGRYLQYAVGNEQVSDVWCEHVHFASRKSLREQHSASGCGFLFLCEIQDLKLFSQNYEWLHHHIILSNGLWFRG